MSTAHESAELILKLYELRREDKLRAGREWFGGFNPSTTQDIIDVVRGEHSAYFRMVTSYWDMAASLVNNNAIDEQMFNDANGEHFGVFAKVEPFLEELRTTFNLPGYLTQLERLIMRQPNAKARLAQSRERARRMTAARAEKKG